MEKTYYFADDDFVDAVYGNVDSAVCIDLNEIKILAREWDMTTAELLEQFHEATPAEIEEYGISTGW